MTGMRQEFSSDRRVAGIRGRLTWSGFCLFSCAFLLGPSALDAQGDYQVVAVAEGATLKGQAVFHGDVPEVRQLLITKDEEVCGTGYRERYDVIIEDGGGLQGVVVFIEDVDAGKAWPNAGQDHVLDQRNCTFAPHLQVVPRGADLKIVNSDPVLHNIHSYERIGRARRTLFNFGQPPEKGAITQPLRPRRGNQIRLQCDAHDFMQGWIFAADSPYSVVVDRDGSFRIDDIPPGEYTIKAWHPFLGVQEQTVIVGSGGSSEITFDFTGG